MTLSWNDFVYKTKQIPDTFRTNPLLNNDKPLVCKNAPFFALYTLPCKPRHVWPERRICKPKMPKAAKIRI